MPLWWARELVLTVKTTKKQFHGTADKTTCVPDNRNTIPYRNVTPVAAFYV